MTDDRSQSQPSFSYEMPTRPGPLARRPSPGPLHADAMDLEPSVISTAPEPAPVEIPPSVEDEPVELEPSLIPTRKDYVLVTPEKLKKVVDFVREHGKHHRLMAQLIGITRETLRQHLKNNEAFAEAIDLAMEERCKALEDEARRRAMVGVTRRKYDKNGQLLEEEQVYSDRLMERLLEADMPERFRPNRGGQILETGGVLLIPVGGPAMSPEEITQRLEKLTEVQTDLRLKAETDQSGLE